MGGKPVGDTVLLRDFVIEKQSGGLKRREEIAMKETLGA
jgi:hypothetical protein